MMRATLTLLIAASLAATAAADTFTVRTSRTDKETFEGHVYAQADDGTLAMMRRDGSLTIAPAGAVLEREPGDKPEPLTGGEMASKLEERFGAELTRTHVCDPFVVVLKLAAPLEKDRRPFVKKFFKQVQTFLLQLNRNFGSWSKNMGLPAEDPEYPLVVVVFETDEDFEAYARETMAGGGLSAGNVTGFYSGGTNWLAVRLDECDNFQLPLHEGIHQQVYNRGWFKRLAPVPTWFNEGIATGFENEGTKLRGDPRKVSAEYVARSARPMAVSFAEVIAEDRTFRGDVLAGEAYTRAWALHWLVVNRRTKQYAEYVRRLGEREPLQRATADDRLEEFEETFDIDVADLQEMYVREVTKEARRQNVRPPRRGPDGRSMKQDQGGLVRVFVSTDGRTIKSYGELQNINPFRSLDFRVRVVPTGLPPIEWVVRDLGAKRTLRLDAKSMPAAAGTFRLGVESAVPGSDKAKAWGGDAMRR